MGTGIRAGEYAGQIRAVSVLRPAVSYELRTEIALTLPNCGPYDHRACHPTAGAITLGGVAP